MTIGVEMLMDIYVYMRHFTVSGFVFLGSFISGLVSERNLETTWHIRSLCCNVVYFARFRELV